MTCSAREEAFDLDGGLGQLRIRGDEFETGLFWGETPIALIWNDNEGSIGQMLAHAETLDASNELRQMRRAADGFLEPDAPLWSQIYPLLRLFENGAYHLHDRRAGMTWDLIEHEQVLSIDRFYPFDAFVMTQPSRGLTRSRIDHFADRIRHGDLPIAFCTRTHASHAPFVVDGHHKLVAYFECKVPPRVVEIVRQEAVPISESAERSFFADSDSHRALLEARKRIR